MFDFTTLTLVGIIAFFVGGIAGSAMTRLLMPREQQNRAMEERLRKSEQDLREYQSQVSDHFAETSLRVNNLTRTYKEMHEFLTSSALQLSNPDIGRSFFSSNLGDQPSLEDSDLSTTLEAPKDWAPNKGTLSESFGLKEEEASDTHASVSPHAPAASPGKA